MTTYPLSALRAVALHTQGLDKATSSSPSRDSIYNIFDQIGCIQIDTLHMVRRSQYLVLWSRLGNYNPTDFDALTSAADRRLFEGWQHAASIIPLTEYRYQIPAQRDLREHPTNWYNRWLNDTVQREFVPQVRERVRREGPLKVSDFESAGQPGGTWWNWRPAKVALEFLYAYGELMISDRVNFQRIYDLPEHVLPGWVDLSEPTVEERDRFWVERGAKALGVCMLRHAGDYTWMKVSRSGPIVKTMIKEGVLLPINGKMANGKTEQLIVHRDHFALLQQAADCELKAERTTFLSPFDNLWWARQRDVQIWGFHQSLEAYLPAHKRIHGYYCMPILHKDKLIGRFDPKLVRKTGTLILKSISLEPGVKPGERLVKDTAEALRDFLNFHSAKELVIERSEPTELAERLLKKI